RICVRCSSVSDVIRLYGMNNRPPVGRVVGADGLVVGSAARVAIANAPMMTNVNSQFSRCMVLPFWVFPKELMRCSPLTAEMYVVAPIQIDFGETFRQRYLFFCVVSNKGLLI